MSLLTSIVDLDSIQLNSAPFAPTDRQAEIETLAHAIVELRGLLKIPVVRELGIDDYELVSGHLEYYAFLKAREIDDQLPDRLTVFILKPNNEEAILKQLEASQAIQQATTSSNNSPQSDATLALKVNNLESRLDQNAKQTSAELAQFKAEVLAAIDTKLPQPLPALEAFNQIQDPVIKVQVVSKLTFLGKKKAETIVALLQEYKTNNNNAEFRQFSEVRKALGTGILSPEKMLEVIDQWNS